MPVNKNAAFRYRIIDEFLRNKRKKYPSLEDIQEKVTSVLGLDVLISASSINKDFKVMRDFYQAPIKFNSYEKGYFYEDPEFSINSFPLSTEEIEVLDLSTAFLKQLKFSGYFNHFEGAIDKLISGFRVSKIPGFEKKMLIQTEEPTANTGVDWLDTLYIAILEQKPVLINYHRFNAKKATNHLFSPYVLREYRNRWYLTGYSSEGKNITTLALDRIVDCEISQNRFILDESFNATDFFKYSFGATVHANAKPYSVQLLFDKALEGYLNTKPLHHTQQMSIENNDILVKIDCYLTPELEMTILGYGEQVKVLAPAEFVNTIKRRVKAMGYVYK
jgi:predicted DNA-binding transcriptional regulator YafY